uniref:Uncharacterized protein n=1 Tax=Panstrongylus lignarius TaxID=156445 RepID=A0A224Y0M5_9HEMI
MGFLTWAAVTGIGAAALLIPPLTVPIAGYLGFGSAGVAAGTMAAGAQSYVANVAAGTIFAKLQAAAMLAPTP